VTGDSCKWALEFALSTFHSLFAVQSESASNPEKHYGRQVAWSQRGLSGIDER